MAKKMVSPIARSRQRLLDFIRINHRCLTKYGPRFAVEITLAALGFKIYTTANYPVNNVKAMVRVNTFWKELDSLEGIESNCMKYISPFVKKSSTILDIGAWEGPYTLFFATLMQGKGHVYAFEPDRAAFDVLRDNVERNRLANVHLERFCIANYVGTAELKTKRFGNSGSSMIGDTSLEISGSAQAYLRLVVKTTTIDQYCHDNHVLPDGIKIDVEGAEGLVIDGSRKTLERAHPWVLLEFHRMLMSKKEALKNWDKIVGPAKKTVFIDGDSNEYRCGDQVKRMPDCKPQRTFHVFVQY